MWTYHQEDLRRRLSLQDSEAFLLDYWLFLHADETHSIWNARPLGIQFLAETALTATGSQHRVLIQAVAKELCSLTKVGRLLPVPAPGDHPLDAGSGQLSAAWMGWLKDAHAEGFRADFLTALESAADTAVASADYQYLAFVLRRLAAELAGDDTAQHAIISQAKQAILYSSDPSDTSARIRAALHPGQDEQYKVNFAVTPVSIPSTVALGALKRENSVLLLDGESDAPKMLTAIEVLVKAHHPSQAMHRAVPMVRQVLQQLKLRHYIRATVHGVVKISQVSSEADPNQYSLPMPFWSKHNSVRKLPIIPGSMNRVLPRLPESHRARWIAAAWHVSNAISVWPEDIHAAASEVWQGMEAFAGSPREVASELVLQPHVCV